MEKRIGRRELMGGAGALALAGRLGAEAAAEKAATPKKVIGLSCSLRPGKTTAAAVTLCLKAVTEANPDIETELIDLAKLSIPAGPSAGMPLKEGEKDDFPALAEKLVAEDVAGIVIGSPVYFNNLSSLCKAFLERIIVFRKQQFALQGKVAGAVAVGGARNGGQELTLQAIRSALTAQDVLLAHTAPPTTRIGASLWNQKDRIEDDEFGKQTAADLGRRIAEMIG
jgi:multimeric flavodoxin WrbA